MAALTAQARRLAGMLMDVSTAEGTYPEACELWTQMQSLRASMELVRARRAALWHVHQASELERRSAERRAARERTRVAELEADRLGSEHGRGRS